MGWSLLNVLALWACIYHLIPLSEYNGPSGRSLFNVMALQADRFSTYWPFGPALFNVMALRACLF
jgi:hypothetical protein